jgi:hypothetical protein
MLHSCLRLAALNSAALADNALPSVPAPAPNPCLATPLVVHSPVTKADNYHAQRCDNRPACPSCNVFLFKSTTSDCDTEKI